LRDPQRRESRPGTIRAADSENKLQAGGPGPSVPPVPDFASMNTRGQHVAMEYWRSGYQYGWAAGFAAAEAAQAELDRRAAAVVSAATRHPDLATLAERRGEPERAERQRRILAERGIV